MDNQDELKRCPKCCGGMVKISVYAALEERWICTNSNCGHEEHKSLLEDLLGKSKQDKNLNSKGRDSA